MALTPQQKANLGKKQRAYDTEEFEYLRQFFPQRITILYEGDSWFAYPPKWVFAGKPSNLVSHLCRHTWRKANVLSMASNGDEAVDMVTGDQKHDLVKILRWHTRTGTENQKPVDLLLFSGGGNDVVGENDFERFLKKYKSAYKTGRQCVNMERLNRKVKQIGLAYQELLDIRDHYTPTTLVMTHTYDYPYPSDTGAVFLGGLIKTKAWMKRFMDKEGIPGALQADVIKVFMDTMAEEILKIAAKRQGFVAVDTRGTLKGKAEWLNEIHPNADGFKAIAGKIFEEMKTRFPALS